MFGRRLSIVIARLCELDNLRSLDDRMLDDIGISRREAVLGRPIGRHACALGPHCPRCRARDLTSSGRNSQNACNEYPLYS